MSIMFPGITHDRCATAFKIAVSSLEVSEHLGGANKIAGTAVVVGPQAPHLTLGDLEAATANLQHVRRHALFIRRVDDELEGATRYDDIALTKALHLWACRSLLGPNFSGLEVQQLMPHLYVDGMTKWHGAVCRNGVVYSFSGVQGHYDMAFAETMAVWVEAMCRQAMADSVLPGSSDYISLG